MRIFFEGSFNNTAAQKNIVQQMQEKKTVNVMEYEEWPIVEVVVESIKSDGTVVCNVKGVNVVIPCQEVSCCGKKVAVDSRLIVELTEEQYDDANVITGYIASRRRVQERYYAYLRETVRVKRDILDARVVGVRSDIVFLDFGYGISSCLSNLNATQVLIKDMHDCFKRGDLVKCVLQKPLTEDYRIYITQKPLVGTWEDNVEKVGVADGSTHTGVVTSIYSYGIFVALNNNLVGLADPVDDMDVAVGDTVEVRVREVYARRNKIKLVITGVKTGVKSNVMRHDETAYFVDEYKQFASTDTTDVWLYGADFKSNRDVIFETV